MADIRDLVESDRGILKRIQAFLPGYKIYRTCEDLRSADNILRSSLVRKLEAMADNIKDTRKNISSRMDMKNLNIIGELVNLGDSVTGKVRHAQQGYSPWISGDVRIEEDELRKLYDYDLSLVTDMDNMLEMSEKLKRSSESDDKDIGVVMGEMREILIRFDRKFKERIDKVTEVAQE